MRLVAARRQPFQRFSGSPFNALYHRWIVGGERALAAHAGLPVSGGAPSVGRLVVEPLPFDYSQFGSLPGIA